MRGRLSYANVMATLALFVALGGGAYALSRNEVKSRHIAPDQVKAADTSDKLRLECPAATRYHEGACIETDNRAGLDWDAALADCRSDGRRLPTQAELLSFRLEPGITLDAFAEWTDQKDENSANAIGVAEDGSRAAFGSGTAMLPYRCVAPATR